MQSNALALRACERLLAGCHGRGLDVAVADQLDDALPRRLVVLHHQQPLDRTVHELVQRRERVRERFLGRGLGQEVDRAQPESALPVLLDRDDVHRDVPRGRVVLQPVEDGPAVRVGQPEVERDGGGLVLPRHGERPVGASGPPGP